MIVQNLASPPNSKLYNFKCKWCFAAIHCYFLNTFPCLTSFPSNEPSWQVSPHSYISHDQITSKQKGLILAPVKLEKCFYARRQWEKKQLACKSLFSGSVYMPPDATVMTRASGAAFSNNGITSSVKVYVAATLTAKLSSNLLQRQKKEELIFWMVNYQDMLFLGYINV